MPDQKFTLSEIGTPEEEISFAKRQFEKPKTYRQRHESKIRESDLKAIKIYLENLERMLKNIDIRLERLEK